MNSNQALSTRILDIQCISKQEQLYCGWPTLARRRNGEILAACSGNRHYHVCPYGRILLFRSHDMGVTWRQPATLSCGPNDDRDGGIIETQDGLLVLTWFSSLAYNKYLQSEKFPFTDHLPDSEASKMPGRERKEWERVRDSRSDSARLSELGCYASISEDGGLTWSEKVDTVVHSPHGPISLSDGRLFYAGRFRKYGEIGINNSPFDIRIGAAESLDGGKTWRKLSEIAPMVGHHGTYYCELHAVEAADGRIVVHIRNNREAPENEILQTQSFDGGRTWEAVRSTGIWGYPSHLIRLRDNRLLASYSHRRDPMGNSFLLSEDHGQSWTKPILLTRSEGNDFGYPSTVELEDNQFLTLWYERKPEEQFAGLYLARWEFCD